ncbi:MAG: hypothetical protein ABFD82_02030 [Syntrophaceae bacterium]
MDKMLYLFRSINILNFVLLLIASAIAYFMITPLIYLDVQASLPQSKEESASPIEQTAASQSPSPADYAVISDQNLFHPERRIPPEKKEEKEIPKPEVVLYGTMIMDGASIAYVEDAKVPYSTPGRGKRQRVLKKGDSLSGYILKEIEPNRIVLARGKDVIVANLHDGGKRKTGSALVSPTSISPSGASKAFPSTVPSTPQPVRFPSTVAPGAPVPRPANPNYSPGAVSK